MNLTDLGEVLRERAELPDSSHEARMAGVRARVSATRRRRAVAGVACVVLALVGIVHAVLPRPDRQPGPAVPPRSLPEYQAGTRLIAQAWADLPTTSVTVRFVPKSTDLRIFTPCDIGEDRSLLVDITVNGEPLVEHTDCRGDLATEWGKLGVVPGQPSVITMTALGARGPGEPGHSQVLPLPTSGTFALGVGEAVPVSEYPFPPRPQNLPKFQPYSSSAIKLRADPAAPARREDFTIEWPGRTMMMAEMNTPGRMRVLVDDVVVADFSHWTYTVLTSQVTIPEWRERYGLALSAGQTVKVTVIAERTGDWQVTFDPR